jgi:NTE family protein
VIEEKCLKKSFAHAYYTVPIPVRVAVIPIFIVPHLFGYHPYDGLYVGNKFANYMNDSLPATRRDIEELKIPYCAVAANLLDGKAYSLTTGNLGRAIQASSAVPELRRPVAIDDKLFVDGGIEANLPVKQAKEMGADLVIAIDVDEKFDARRRDFRKILSVGHRVINMILTKVDEEQVKLADILVQPDVNGIHLLSNKTADGLKAIKAGELAAEAALPEIRRRIQAATMAAN